MDSSKYIYKHASLRPHLWGDGAVCSHILWAVWTKMCPATQLTSSDLLQFHNEQKVFFISSSVRLKTIIWSCVYVYRAGRCDLPTNDHWWQILMPSEKWRTWSCPLVIGSSLHKATDVCDIKKKPLLECFLCRHAVRGKIVFQLKCALFVCVIHYIFPPVYHGRLFHHLLVDYGYSWSFWKAGN